MNLLKTYKALADESRLRMALILSLGYFNVGELTELLGLGQSTVSHHLRILSNSGIVKLHREGTWSFYTLSESAKTGPCREVLTPILLAGVPGEEYSRYFPGGPETLPSDRKDFVDDLQAENKELSLQLLRDFREAKSTIEQRRSSTRRYFESVGPDWNVLRSEAQGGDEGLLYILDKIPSDGTLLDLGCGTGAFVQKLGRRSGETIAVDYSQAMLDEARRAVTELNIQVDFRLGYLEHLPVANDSIDTAVAHMVLHHIPDPVEAIREVHRVLAPGGTFWIVDLCKHNDATMQERYADIWLGFQPEALETWCAESGFAEISLLSPPDQPEIFILTGQKQAASLSDTATA